MQLHGLIENYIANSREDDAILKKNKETLMIIRSISQSANTMWYYNTN